jgi:hypothetical protein
VGPGQLVGEGTGRLLGEFGTRCVPNRLGPGVGLEFGTRWVPKLRRAAGVGQIELPDEPQVPLAEPFAELRGQALGELGKQGGPVGCTRCSPLLLFHDLPADVPVRRHHGRIDRPQGVAARPGEDLSDARDAPRRARLHLAHADSSSPQRRHRRFHPGTTTWHRRIPSLPRTGQGERPMPHPPCQRVRKRRR